MAEIFGVVASGLSLGALAGQVASSILKVKAYLDQFKDAPEDIKTLVDEIDDLYLVLSAIEEDQSSNPYLAGRPDDVAASRCLDHCKSRVERLRRIVEEIGDDLEDLKPMKRKWKAAKLIWKQDRVERYRREVASAAKILTLSYQIYTK